MNRLWHPPGRFLNTLERPRTHHGARLLHTRNGECKVYATASALREGTLKESERRLSRLPAQRGPPKGRTVRSNTNGPECRKTIKPGRKGTA